MHTLLSTQVYSFMKCTSSLLPKTVSSSSSSHCHVIQLDNPPVYWLCCLPHSLVSQLSTASVVSFQWVLPAQQLGTRSCGQAVGYTVAHGTEIAPPSNGLQDLFSESHNMFLQCYLSRLLNSLSEWQDMLSWHSSLFLPQIPSSDNLDFSLFICWNCTQ